MQFSGEVQTSRRRYRAKEQNNIIQQKRGYSIKVVPFDGVFSYGSEIATDPITSDRRKGHSSAKLSFLTRGNR